MLNWVVTKSLTTSGLGTLATPLANDTESLITIRFLASLGLGGVTPNCIALVSEYAPTRVKTLFVSIVAVSPLLGGTLGGIASRWIIPVYGWEGVFYAAGGLTIATLIPVLILPESIRFLIATSKDPGRILKAMNRVSRSNEFTDKDSFYLDEPKSTMKLRDLFSRELFGLTIVIWIALAANLFMMVMLINWLPLLLEQQGISSGTEILSVSVLNSGGIAGGIILAIITDRVGIYRTLFCASLLAVIATALIGIMAPDALLVLACVFFSGFLGLGTYAGFSALAAKVYPIRVRATGIGWALSIGKCGAAMAPLAVSAALSAGLSIPSIYFTAATIGLISTLFIPLIYWKSTQQY